MFGLSIINSGKTRKDSAISVAIGNKTFVIYDCIIDNYRTGIYVHSGVIGLFLSAYNQITNGTCGIKVEADRFIISNIMFQLEGNLIKNNRYGVIIKESGSLIGINMMMYNTLENNRIGILLLRGKYNFIMQNNFIDNTIHSLFFRSTFTNLYLANYWDNWRGHRKPNKIFMPKYIFGTRGFLGVRLKPLKDLFPSRGIIEVINPFEF
jgi:parallel beta-helix repeat protein